MPEDLDVHYLWTNELTLRCMHAGQLKELGVEYSSTSLELAQQAEHSWTPSCQLALAPAQERNAHPAPQLLLDTADDQVSTPTLLAGPALQVCICYHLLTCLLHGSMCRTLMHLTHKVLRM